MTDKGSRKNLLAQKITVFVLAAAGALVFLVIYYSGRQGSVALDDNGTYGATPVRSAGLEIKDVSIGEGEEAQRGGKVSVHYTGTLQNGDKFDSSYDRGEPFSFTLGAGEVISGWDKGILGMKVGGKRILTVPPDLAYGDRTVGSIPANSTLIFEVELIGILGH